MAHRGSPGIHAGRPTPQNLLSASRKGWQIKSIAPRGGRPAGLFGLSVCFCSSCRGTKAAFGCAAVVKPDTAVRQVISGSSFTTASSQWRTISIAAFVPRQLLQEHCNCGSEPAREGCSRAGSLPQIGLDLQQSIYRTIRADAATHSRSCRIDRSASGLYCPGHCLARPHSLCDP